MNSEQPIYAAPAGRGKPLLRSSSGPNTMSGRRRALAFDDVEVLRLRSPAQSGVRSMTIRTSTVTCPSCGHEETETMPSNACVHFYECTACRTVLRPKPGDCCVFCSYGSSRCPPRQREGT